MLLYLHIPFCDSKCAYCNFNSYVDKFSLRQDYMAAVLTQLDRELKRFQPLQHGIETLFIGGGTPSTIPAQWYAPLFKRVAPYLAPNAEITTEANPNSATLSWLQGMRALGVNRVSFGVQSFNDTKLKRLQRAHHGDEAIRAIRHARDAGFEHISMDLIYGVAGDTQTLLKKDLETAFSLDIDHISAYALTIEEGTPFQQTPEVAQERLELTTWLFETIAAHGFEQYEISNFGTYHSQHNLGYWQYQNYIGVGSGAVGFLNDTRYYPTPQIETYIAQPLTIRQETLDEEAIKTERLFLGLRSIVGVSPSLLNPEEHQRAMLLVEEGKLYVDDRRFYNPDYLLSDELVLFILT